MNNQTERFLTFASEKMVTVEGFYYCFNDTGIEFMPSDSELWLTLTFEGQLETTYIQYEGTKSIVEVTERFPEDVKVTEIIKWLKSKIK
jgi:hypothetical protein